MPAPAVQKWRFFDPYDTDPTTNTYTVPVNPNKMTSPFPTRNVSTKATTAVDGQTLFIEGQASPASWSFAGDIFDSAHYEALRSWVYDRRRRIQIYDHFGRQINCVLESFTPTPKRSTAKYWRHEYEIKATVTSVGAPTVGDIWG